MFPLIKITPAPLVRESVPSCKETDPFTYLGGASLVVVGPISRPQWLGLTNFKKASLSLPGHGRRVRIQIGGILSRLGTTPLGVPASDPQATKHIDRCRHRKIVLAAARTRQLEHASYHQTAYPPNKSLMRDRCSENSAHNILSHR